MLNFAIGEAVVLKDPMKIDSKTDSGKYFAIMSLGIPPFGADKEWLKKMISDGRKTGYVFANAITVSGWPTIYSLENLRRGDLISFVGSLSMMNEKEVGDKGYKLQKSIGIRIDKIEKIASGFIKYDKQNIQKSTGMIRAAGKTSRSNRNSYQSQGDNTVQDKPGSYQKNNRILDDTEFDFGE